MLNVGKWPYIIVENVEISDQPVNPDQDLLCLQCNKRFCQRVTKAPTRLRGYPCFTFLAFRTVRERWEPDQPVNPDQDLLCLQCNKRFCQRVTKAPTRLRGYPCFTFLAFRTVRERWEPDPGLHEYPFIELCNLIFYPPPPPPPYALLVT